MKQTKVMILAGGTGGHVMPAVAVARYLVGKGVAVHWMGTKRGIEAKVVPLNDIPIDYIHIQGLRNKGWLSWMMAPWRLLRAFFQAFSIIQKVKPDVVLSMGGYVSGPGALVAWLCRKPLVLHEQNAILGWTNRLLSRLATRIMVAFPEVIPTLPIPSKGVHTGNPVREEIMHIALGKDALQKTEHPRVLILGGSQGASILNKTVPEAIALLPQDKRPKCWHQTGQHDYDTTDAAYKRLSLEAKVMPFIQDMNVAYEWADIVVCRSGALTVAELAIAGVASILIPFPHAVDDHQTFNAKYLSDKGGAYLLPQTALNAESLKEKLLEWIENNNERMAIARRCQALAYPLATQQVADQCLEVYRG